VRLALVLWSGRYGGAERSTLSLARHLRERGVEPTIVFVGEAGPIGTRATEVGVPHVTLGIARGSRVLLRPRRLVSVARTTGPDGALVVSSGYLSGALRLGGYRAPIVAVEHGSLLQRERLGLPRRILRSVDRGIGARCSDADVAVSDFVREALSRSRHSRRLLRIHHGIDLREFHPVARNGRPRGADPVTLGCAARLIPGKGVDDLLRALPRVAPAGWRLRVAGDGPERERLEAIAGALGVRERVLFLGWVADMAAFWRAVDVAVVPSGALPEAFGMSALEAIACGVPVVATRNGGLPEIVADGECGLLVTPGDVEGIARALSLLGSDDALRERLSRGARRRAQERFSGAKCARDYESLFLETRAEPSAPRPGNDPPEIHR
jgi:glycosyltransferase involved in cell wall biosynthesis